MYIYIYVYTYTYPYTNRYIHRYLHVKNYYTEIKTSTFVILFHYTKLIKYLTKQVPSSKYQNKYETPKTEFPRNNNTTSPSSTTKSFTNVHNDPDTAKGL